ncbi:maltokinase N-terminal cap-like domain-containing protein [Croceimicrobium hydrocarbonivorans]|uniref:Maltokinase n=1 Tax=Croceimicrobium hydrocarbonivorans TaxID=2761580 RepID=A0A7H0VCF9_9FLAO|nr:trehalose synthase [Croceimicrobium hydrocarbonivorans]QNR23407.1 trehalose synthase [Croceimicrobium hydrocarbonivorans]
MNLPKLQSAQSWDQLRKDESFWEALRQDILPQHLYHCRWFGGKASVVQQVFFSQKLLLKSGFQHYYLLLIEVFFRESYAHNYFLPLAIAESREKLPAQAVLAEIQLADGSFYLIDAVHDSGFHAALFRKIVNHEMLMEGNNRVFFRAHQELEMEPEGFRSQLLNAEQSNSTLIIQDRYYLKIFRRLFRDKNPDFEMNEFLAQQKLFENYPKLAGLIWWEPGPGVNISLGLMQEKVPNEGDAWPWMLKEVEQYFKNGDLAGLSAIDKWPLVSPLKISKLPAALQQNPGLDFFKRIRTLAQRTAEMHLALAAVKRDRHFAPINYNGDFTVWLKNRLIYQFDARYNLLNKKLESLPENARLLAEKVLEQKDLIINFILGFDEEQLRSLRIRIHGDYHLGQILIQGHDFFILDYEGEPESTIRDRKVKQSPLKDVAGLLRSFHYAIHAVQKNQNLRSLEHQAAGQSLYQAISGVFLHSYFKIAFQQQLDIGYRKEITYLLHYFLLEKAIYELGYELNGRPDWAIIPLEGILDITDEIKRHAY